MQDNVTFLTSNSMNKAILLDILKKSINFFINTVEKKEYFDLHHFESSISTTREIIKFHKLNNDISNS